MNERFVEVNAERAASATSTEPLPCISVSSPCSLTTCLDGRTNDDAAALVTRNGALDQDQVAIGIDADDFEVLDGAAHVAHVAGHLLALEDAARRLVLTDGTRSAVRQRVAVRRVLGAEVVTLDRTGEALTDGRADDVDLLARLEQVNLELAAGSISAPSPSSRRNSAMMSPASTFALAKWPA